ncbi:hypothetical protein [Aeoliella sp.]|uniref:hypothetical protein n=1 Tax=Aeoliella sp. TaxID=2795800 RepID=UPI003CCBB7D8
MLALFIHSPFQLLASLLQGTLSLGSALFVPTNCWWARPTGAIGFAIAWLHNPTRLALLDLLQSAQLLFHPLDPFGELLEFLLLRPDCGHDAWVRLGRRRFPFTSGSLAFGSFSLWPLALGTLTFSASGFGLVAFPFPWAFRLALRPALAWCAAFALHLRDTLAECLNPVNISVTLLCLLFLDFHFDDILIENYSHRAEELWFVCVYLGCRWLLWLPRLFGVHLQELWLVPTQCFTVGLVQRQRGDEVLVHVAKHHAAGLGGRDVLLLGFDAGERCFDVLLPGFVAASGLGSAARTDGCQYADSTKVANPPEHGRPFHEESPWSDAVVLLGHRRRATSTVARDGRRVKQQRSKSARSPEASGLGASASTAATAGRTAARWRPA